MRTSQVILLGLVIGTVATLVPCSLLHTEGAASRITFTIWGMPFEDRLFEDGYARGFEAETPGVRVDYQRFDGDMINMKYKAWHAAGTGAEVMRIMVTDYHQMVAAGMLEPLDAWIDDPTGLSASERAAFPSHLLDTLRVDGRLYALPEDNAQYGLYYNRSIIDAFNEDHPDDPIVYPNAEWTWNDLRRAARRLDTDDIHGIDMAIWQWPFMNFLAQAGGQLWSEDGRSTLIASDEGVDALEFLGQLVVDGSWEPYFGRGQGTGPDSRFVNGSTALYLDGSWMVPNFEQRNPDLDFAVAPMPRGRVPAVVCGSCLWGISANASRKDLGWRMLRWLVAEEQAAQYWDALRVAPPAHLGVIGSDRFKSTSGIARVDDPTKYDVLPMPPERYQQRAAWLEYAVTRHPETGAAPGFVPVSLHQRALENEIGAMLQKYLRDPANEDASEMLERAARAVQAEIERAVP